MVFAKKQDLRPRPIQLANFFKEYMPLIEQSAGMRNRLSLVIESDSTIYADETQLVSALINLCANSSQALLTQETNPEVKIVVRDVEFSELIGEGGSSFLSFSKVAKQSPLFTHQIFKV